MIRKSRSIVGIIMLALLAMALLSACSAEASGPGPVESQSSAVVTVYKAPT